jgi:hypothetical protein
MLGVNLSKTISPALEASDRRPAEAGTLLTVGKPYSSAQDEAQRKLMRE